MRCLISRSCFVISIPKYETDPPERRIMFSMDFIVVVFPAPFRPINPIIRPRCIVKLISCRRKLS